MLPGNPESKELKDRWALREPLAQKDQLDLLEMQESPECLERTVIRDPRVGAQFYFSINFEFILNYIYHFCFIKLNKLKNIVHNN